MLAALERTGLANDTLVLFLSDNKPPFVNYFKTTLYDAGLCLPFLMCALGASRTSDVVNPNLVSWIDVLPTMLARAGREGRRPPEGLEDGGTHKQTAGDDRQAHPQEQHPPPAEERNLADEPAHAETQKEMRLAVEAWQYETHDLWLWKDGMSVQRFREFDYEREGLRFLTGWTLMSIAPGRRG
ncbi:hypothetical protein PLICBS_004101 [Purpureocillium lilacinum]|uniref:uncharacterized protein n=1 Tax=Purpureocillium lilacinum TaxID=33203 RepID=UPI00208A03AC|nr:hypothetical protein PLICBS_004101 [Purpureocillium lilacinum]